MDYEQKWRKVIEEPLGEGGQGKVFLVKNRIKEFEAHALITQAIRSLSTSIRTKSIDDEIADVERLSLGIHTSIQSNEPKELGALKVLHDPRDAREAKRAAKRIKNEIRAMSEIEHPNLLKILEFDEDYKWFVSEFHVNGSLAKEENSGRYKGKFLNALKDVRPLVEGVAKLHKDNQVHRDVKPHNVFISQNQDLILGDFGLVFFIDNQRTRLSATYENVGSRDWMPAWAQGIRIEDLKPSFDVFSLGKLIWSMVSGEQFLNLWYYDRKKFDLVSKFPENPEMKLANELFSKCIVEEEENCLFDAVFLLDEIDELIQKIELRHENLAFDNERLCQVCHKGKYIYKFNGERAAMRYFGFYTDANQNEKKIGFVCDNCGHVQLFSYVGEILPDEWTE